ncbi:uncharacterized protein LOC73410 [Mus musculus]|uniref:uncharacterized protein LOC73410 n=1 Tax=Mus musculus TaxID=10090 RepID=UPI00028BC737|nr:uncharacterized protein LOC73410 [Mus musculus]|eukprot:NP_001258498.1 uncharacterized protein LOC73410 [Mus musculus]
MDASSSPWSPMVTPSGSQNSRRRRRASPQPPPVERAERRRSPARSKILLPEAALGCGWNPGEIPEATGAEPTADVPAHFPSQAMLVDQDVSTQLIHQRHACLPVALVSAIIVMDSNPLKL